MNIKKNIAVTILTTSFLISGISNPIKIMLFSY